jgi:hypothetical protein
MSKSNTTVVVKSFVKQFAALLQGDTAEVTAQKVFRQVQSSLNTQIAVMNGDLVAKEDAVTDAKEELDKARLNYGKELASSDRTAYVRNLITKKNAVESAQEALDTHLETLHFLKGELVRLESEV